MDRIKKLLEKAKNQADLLQSHAAGVTIDQVVGMLESHRSDVEILTRVLALIESRPDPKILVSALEDIRDNALEMLAPLALATTKGEGASVKAHYQVDRIKAVAREALEAYDTKK